MDVEGAEFDILSPVVLEKLLHSTIVIEIHNWINDFTPIFCVQNLYLIYLKLKCFLPCLEIFTNIKSYVILLMTTGCYWFDETLPNALETLSNALNCHFLPQNKRQQKIPNVKLLAADITKAEIREPLSAQFVEPMAEKYISKRNSVQKTNQIKALKRRSPYANVRSLRWAYSVSS